MGLTFPPYSLAERTFSVVADPDAFLTHGLRFEPGGEAQRVPLPAMIRPDVRLEPGPIALPVRQAVAVAVAVVQRIAPWCTVTVAPIILGAGDDFATGSHVERDGTRFQQWGGLYLPETQEVVLGAGRSITYLFATATHEAWHALEARLSDEAKDTLSACLTMPAVPESHPYWGDREEHRARAFETWTARFFAGLPSFIATTELDAIFAAAWTGELGNVLANQK